MTYYTETVIDVAQARETAEAIDGFASVTFPSSTDGTFVFRINGPLIGQQISVLPDVSIIDFGSPEASLIQNAAVFLSPSIFQVFEYRDDNGFVQHRLVDISGNSETRADEVLAQRYPLALNNSFFGTTEVGPGHSSSEDTLTGRWLDEFYITVAGNRGVADQLGVDMPNDGRVLITTGAVTGMRDLAWGSGWVDTVKPAAPPTQEMVDADQDLSDIKAAQEAKIADVTAKLELAKENLAIQKERLASLSDEDALTSWLLAAQATELAAELAGAFTPSSMWKGKEALEAIYGNLELVGQASDLAEQFAATLKNPSTENFHELYQSTTGFITSATDYKTASSSILDGLNVASSVVEFFNNVENWSDDKSTIAANIAVTQRIIQGLENEIKRLEDIQQQSTGSSDIIQDGGTVIIRAPDASSIYMFEKNGIVGSSTLKASSPETIDVFQQVTLGADGQAVIATAALTIINGTLSSGDKIVIGGSSTDYEVDTRLELIRVWTLNRDTGFVEEEIAHLQDVDGIQFDDLVVGNSGNNILRSAGVGHVLGMAGDDRLYGEGGNDSLEGGQGADAMDGAAGVDTASYASATKGITASLAKPSMNTNDAKGDTFKAIENLQGSGFGDALYGNTGDNALKGGAGSDKLYGDKGNDVLDGGSGADAMFGQVGNDIYYVNSSKDIVSEKAGEGLDTVRSSVSWTLTSSVEQLRLLGQVNINGIGNELNNLLVGNGGDNRLNGGAGSDRLIGGSGTDTASYSNAGRAVGVSLWNPSSNTGDAAGDTFSSIENLSGTSYSDRLEGNAGVNRIVSGAGNDRIYGGSAGDHLYGGSGGDTFIYKKVAESTMAARDMIFDFSQASGDRISIAAIDANTRATGDQAFNFIGSARFSGKAGELRYINQNGDTYIYGDVNGDGVTDFSVRLDDQVKLKAVDFVL
jgi:serralysin